MKENISSFRVCCPKCSSSLSVPETARGQKVRCAGCGALVQTKPGNHKVSFRNCKPSRKT